MSTSLQVSTLMLCVPIVFCFVFLFPHANVRLSFFFVLTFLIPVDIVLRILETPEQMLVLREVRPKLNVKDLEAFEKLVSQKELNAIKTLSAFLKGSCRLEL